MKDIEELFAKGLFNGFAPDETTAFLRRCKSIKQSLCKQFLYIFHNQTFLSCNVRSVARESSKSSMVKVNVCESVALPQVVKQPPNNSIFIKDTCFSADCILWLTLNEALNLE